MKKRFFFIIAIIHFALVFSDMVAYRYTQSGDSPRYMAVANEFFSLNFLNENPGINCHTAPGYPLFLAVIKPITHQNKYFIAFIQSLIFCVCCYYFIAKLYQRKYLTESLCMICYALILFSPDIFQSNSYTLTESLLGSMILLSIGLILEPRQTIKTEILLITSVCLLVFLKFEYLLILPVFFLQLAWFKNYKLIGKIAVTLTLLLTLNGARNYHIYEKFNPFGFGAGYVIYGGNNQNGDASFHSAFVKGYLPEGKAEEERKILAMPTKCACVAEDTFFKTMAKDAFLSDPMGNIKSIPQKFSKLWLIPASMDFYTGDETMTKGLRLNTLFDTTRYPWYAPYKHAFYLGLYWLYLSLSILGIYIRFKKEGMSDIDKAFISILVIITLLYSIPFYGLGRFHMPVVALLFIYSGLGFEYLWGRIRSLRDN